jgi:DNA (cytosine-5)-methyltransferase 1
MTTKPTFTVVDLFAGCGGLSLGLELAGFHPVFVNELNEHALESYLMNRVDLEPRLRDRSFHCHDVKTLVNEPGRIEKLIRDLRSSFGLSIASGDLDLLVGGPPCQGFSGIGHRRSYAVDKSQLPSNHLYQDMAWLVSKLRPKAFLFENVRGLLNAKWTPDGVNGEIWEDVQHAFRSIPGYRINAELVFAKNYGVVQNRPRVLLVGVRDDISLQAWDEIASPVANGFLPHSKGGAPDLIDVLGDLVDPDFLPGQLVTERYPSAARLSVQRTYRTRRDGSVAKKGDAVSEHEYSKHSERVFAKFKHMLLNDGEIPAKFQTKKFAQRLLPARWGKVGPTITATSLPDDYVHFAQPRILTVREWARLQGFPDWYSFAGKRTTGGLRRAGNPREGIFDRELPKYTQIGNAVPVLLAKAVGEHFAKILGATKRPAVYGLPNSGRKLVVEERGTEYSTATF